MAHPLAILRAHLGLNQSEFARENGLHPSRINQVEHRRGTLRAEKWAEVSTKYREQLELLGIGLGDLIRGKARRRADPESARVG